MIKDELEIFVDKYCKLILKDGFSYIGRLKKVSETSVTFDDRFDGIYLFDISSVKSICEVRGDRR
ncbi:MAG: hypothetical protein K9N07_10330 [Candidatus Cloacimonetes bacterium]|nr:hypothetical protein [Candidatus Cloacimonadota bacterium]MCF8014064.1 hypothetical protein [Candidatus Woesearchaeota archaeon]